MANAASLLTLSKTWHRRGVAGGRPPAAKMDAIAPVNGIQIGSKRQMSAGTTIAHDHDHEHHGDHGHDHSHDHSELSETALRVRALESMLTRRAGRPRRARRHRRDLRDEVGPRNGAQRGGQGLDRSGLQGASARGRDGGDRRAGLQRPAGRAHGRGREHARTCTTSSSAPCAPAIRGPCWACRRSGTSPRPTARARSSIRAACWPSSASTLPGRARAIRVWDSTAELRYLVLPDAARPAPRAGARSASPLSSPATA